MNHLTSHSKWSSCNSKPGLLTPSLTLCHRCSASYFHVTLEGRITSPLLASLSSLCKMRGVAQIVSGRQVQWAQERDPPASAHPHISPRGHSVAEHIQMPVVTDCFSGSLSFSPYCIQSSLVPFSPHAPTSLPHLPISSRLLALGRFIWSLLPSPTPSCRLSLLPHS